MSAASLIAAQQEFTVHLPAVEKAARWAFGRGRRLRRQDYEEVLAEVCAAAWSAWVGLLRRGKDPVQVGVHGIANNAVRYVRNGRRVANRSGGRGAMDVYHPEAQKDRGFRVINPDSLDETVDGSPPGVWTNSCTPADEACFRVDYAAVARDPVTPAAADRRAADRGAWDPRGGAGDGRDAGRDQPGAVLVARELADVPGRGAGDARLTPRRLVTDERRSARPPVLDRHRVRPAGWTDRSADADRSIRVRSRPSSDQASTSGRAVAARSQEFAGAGPRPDRRGCMIEPLSRGPVACGDVGSRRSPAPGAADRSRPSSSRFTHRVHEAARLRGGRLSSFPGGSMPTLLDHLDTEPRGEPEPPRHDQRRRAAPDHHGRLPGRLHLVGRPATLTAEQKAQAAQAFDAEGQFLSAGKKLLDTKHTAFRAVTAIRTKISDYWKGLSLPFPEPGVRLIKLEAVESFDRQMADYKAELDDAVANLDRHFDELKRSAARRLGSLFNAVRLPRDADRASSASRGTSPPSSRPTTWSSSRPISTSASRSGSGPGSRRPSGWPSRRSSISSPRLVNHLTERITGTNEDGSPKVFRDSAVDNLTDFFERFRSLNVRSQPAARRAGRPGPAGRAERRGPGPARQRGPRAARWPRSSRGCRRRWTPCSWTGRGGGSSATRRHRGPSS